MSIASAIAMGFMGALISLVVQLYTKKLRITSAKGEKKPGVTRMNPFQAIAVFSCLFAGFVAFHVPKVKNAVDGYFLPKAKIERIGAKYEYRFLEHPKAAAMLKSAANPFQLGEELSQKGTKRLSKTDLLNRAQVLRQIIDFGSPGLCAGFWTGSIPKEELVATFEKVPDETLEKFVNISMTAALAEVDQVPFTAVSQENFTASLTQLIAQMDAAEATVVKAALIKSSTGQPIAQDEACTATKAVYGNVSKLPAQEADNLLRFLVQSS